MSLYVIKYDHLSGMTILRSYLYSLYKSYDLYTAISINVVGKRRQAYATRPKGSMPRNHRNNKQRHVLHRICITSAFVILFDHTPFRSDRLGLTPLTDVYWNSCIKIYRRSLGARFWSHLINSYSTSFIRSKTNRASPSWF